MRFPTGTEVSRLRTRHGQRSRIYLGVQRGKERTDSPPPLMVGQHYALVAADAYDNDEHHLTFTVANFLLNSDIRPNMTLAVGTLADPFLHGSARIRLVDTANNRLCLEPNNLDAEGYLATGDYIWVDGVYRLYRILPYIVTGTVYDDGNPDTLLAAPGIPGYGIAFNVNYLDRPVALMGSPRFAWANENVDFYGWRSHGRGGRTIQNWTWDFDGGICDGPGLGFPGSPDSPIHARWPDAGEYVASLLVEDDSGNNALDAYGVPFDRHRAVRPVLVFDRPGLGDNPPYTDFEINSLSGRYGSGWSARITVYGTADKSEFPDNALIILFAEDWHGGVGASMGGWYGQEGILFVGHIRADSVEVDSEKSTVSFEAMTMEQWMKDIDIWPGNFVSDAGAPTAWHHFQAMTVEDVLWYLTEMRSTLKNVTDCFFASDVGVEKLLGFVDLTEASLYDQMSSQLGSCFFGQLSASRSGSVHLAKHKNMLDIGERVWWGPPVYSFAKQDWRDELEVGEERQRDSVAQVDFIGFVYDANGNPLEVYSLAPERQTNFGMIEKVDGVLLSGNSIAAGQAENNTLSGLYRAWKNIRFPHIRVPAYNNRFLEPATLDYFAVVLDPADTVRGYDWDGKEFLCTALSLKFDSEKGHILADVEGEASTWGPDGVAGPYPNDALPPEDAADNPPEYWPDWPVGDPPPWGPTDAEEDDYFPITAYMGLASGHVIRGTGLGPGRADTCRYHNCGLVHADGVQWMALDEFDPENTAMVCTPYRIYKTTNLSDDTPTWDLVLNWGWEFSMVRSSPIQQGLWMVVGQDNVDLHVWVSTTGGASWTERIFTSGNVDGSPLVFLELSAHDSQKAWAMWVDDANNRTYIAATDDRFATQTLTFIPISCFDGNPTQGRPCSHHRTYNNPDDAVDLFGGIYTNGTHYARLYFGTTCITLYTTIAAQDNEGVWMVGCGVRTNDHWWALAYNVTGWGFWISDDGINWTEQIFFPYAGPGANWQGRDAKNIRGNPNWYIMTRDGDTIPLYISIDRGASWTRCWGNWLALVTDEGLGDPNVMVVCPVF